MQYLFRGLRGGTGDAVIGRIIAPSDDLAYNVLTSHGIDVESLLPEFVASGNGVSRARSPLFAPALEDALDEAGLQIRFEQLARHHEGRDVWVLDQDKIRQRLMQLVNEAVRDEAGRQHARSRIAQALDMLCENPGHASPVQPVRSLENSDIEAEISGLAAAMSRMEKAMASMSVAARRGESREQSRTAPGRAVDKTRNEVLIEIFEDNLELMRGTRRQVAAPGTGMSGER